MATEERELAALLQYAYLQYLSSASAVYAAAAPSVAPQRKPKTNISVLVLS